MNSFLPGDAAASPDNSPNARFGQEPEWIEATLIRSSDPLTKTFAVSSDGVPKATGSPFLSTGTATRMHIPVADFASDFAATLKCLHSHSCIVLGALSEALPGDEADITTKDRHQPRSAGDGSPLIWRGKDWLGYRAGQPGILGLDHDAKDLPKSLQERVRNQGGLIAVLSSVCPALATAARVSRPSVSSGIGVIDGGATSVGGGWHIYLPVVDGSDAQGFVARLHDRLVLAGWGYPFVSEAGSVQVRSLVDTAASGVGERLWFEASAVLIGGLEHLAGARDPEIVQGSLLDTRVSLPRLTDAEANLLGQVYVDLRASVAPDAEDKRLRHVKRVREHMVQRGDDEASATEVAACLLDAETRGVLNGRHLLQTDDGRTVSVADILADRASFHRVTCADPIEPLHGGAGTRRFSLRTGVARVFTAMRMADASTRWGSMRLISRLP